jgi:hypothetical protein
LGETRSATASDQASNPRSKWRTDLECNPWNKVADLEPTKKISALYRSRGEEDLALLKRQREASPSPRPIANGDRNSRRQGLERRTHILSNDSMEFQGLSE